MERPFRRQCPIPGTKDWSRIDGLVLLVLPHDVNGKLAVEEVEFSCAKKTYAASRYGGDLGWSLLKRWCANAAVHSARKSLAIPPQKKIDGIIFDRSATPAAVGAWAELF